jgi:hypothetical protein
MKKTYDSFEEVNKDLKILDLRRRIAMEQAKGDVASIKEALQPPEILSVLSSGVLKKFIISTFVGFVLRRFRK